MLGDRGLETGRAASRARPTARDASVDIDLVHLETAESDRRTRSEARPSVEAQLAAIRAARRPRRRAYEATKRALDVLLGPPLLLVALPVIALIALVVKLDSRGPAIFRQTRVGENGRLFTFYKFRTMYADARERFPDLYAYDYSSEETETMFFKLASDPRCTRVGRWLRRTSLDELPNVLNVLMGDMSLVGPRPEIPDMLPYYEVEQLRKFVVKPGMTGIAQISGRNLLTFQETIRHDLEYVDGRSLRADLSVLARTPIVVFQMIGAL